MASEQLNQKRLTKIVNVFLRCFVGNAQQFRHLIVVNFLAGIVDEVMSQFAQRLNVTYFEAFLYVFTKYGLYQTLNIRPLIPKTLHLRKSAVVDIVHEGTLAFGFSLGSYSLYVNMVVLAIF